MDMMSAYPYATSPVIVGARRDGESVVLIVQCERPSPAPWGGKGASARYEFRMSMGLAYHLYDELDEALPSLDESDCMCDGGGPLHPHDTDTCTVVRP